MKWPEAIPLALMLMRTTLSRRTRLSPHKILMERPMRVPYTLPLTIKEMNTHQMDDASCTFCIVLTNIVRAFHLQVKNTLLEATTKDCSDLGPEDNVLIKVNKRRICSGDITRKQ